MVAVTSAPPSAAARTLSPQWVCGYLYILQDLLCKTAQEHSERQTLQFCYLQGNNVQSCSSRTAARWMWRLKFVLGSKLAVCLKCPPPPHLLLSMLREWGQSAWLTMQSLHFPIDRANCHLPPCHNSHWAVNPASLGLIGEVCLFLSGTSSKFIAVGSK